MRVLEDTPVRALVRRLRGLPLGLELGDERLDLVWRARSQPELNFCDDLAGPKLRPPVLQPELLTPEPARAVGVDDESALEDPGPVPTVGARVHPHAPTGRAGNRAREFEPAEARGAR